jgi:hypothetical protein
MRPSRLREINCPREIADCHPVLPKVTAPSGPRTPDILALDELRCPINKTNKKSA